MISSLLHLVGLRPRAICQCDCLLIIHTVLQNIHTYRWQRVKTSHKHFLRKYISNILQSINSSYQNSHAKSTKLAKIEVSSTQLSVSVIIWQIKTSYKIVTLNFTDTYINIISAYYFMDFILRYLIVLHALVFARGILMSQFNCS